MSQKTPNSIVSDRLIDAAHGFQDFDVEGYADLRRVCVPFGIKKGESFNVYHGENSKPGAVWTGDLMSFHSQFASARA
ncbi:hypothetical protein HZR81_19095 [Pseudomonas sp. LM13]